MAGFGLDGVVVVVVVGPLLLATVTTGGGVGEAAGTGVGVLGLLDGAAVVEVVRLVGLGVLGRRWHSVHPSRKRVTASRGRNAYVSVI